MTGHVQESRNGRINAVRLSQTGTNISVPSSLSLRCSLSARPCTLQNLYGSMAFAQTGDGGYAWGIAWNAQSHAKARQLAIDECRWAGGGSAVERSGVSQRLRRHCDGDGDGYGTGWGDSSGEAERTAMNECRSQNNHLPHRD